MGNWSDFNYMNDFSMTYFYYYFKFNLLLPMHLLRKDGALPSLSSFLLTPSHNRGSELSDGCNLGEYNSSQTPLIGAGSLQ